MAEAYEVKPGQGSAWANDNKAEDWHADFRGKILFPNGNEHYIDLWSNVSKQGKTYYGIKIGNPVANASAGTQAPVRHTNTTTESLESIEDDLPF